uniref:Uncharacterized protein n=1 Tax=Strix occidentalis caurina TaxID=311401 RepID=A0A8D0F9L3_STROC
EGKIPCGFGPALSGAEGARGQPGKRREWEEGKSKLQQVTRLSGFFIQDLGLRPSSLQAGRPPRFWLLEPSPDVLSPLCLCRSQLV